MPRHTPIGVDIGSSGVKLAQLGAGRRDWTPVALTQAPWRSGDGEHLVPDDTLVEAIALAKSQGRFRSRRAVVLIPTVLADIRPISVPVAEGIDLMSYVQSDLAERHGERANQFVVDFWIAGDKVEHGETKLELYTVSAPKQSVTALVKAVERAGLVVVRVDIAATSLATALSRAREDGQDASPMHADIGERRSLLFATHTDGIGFCRVIKWGGSQVTEGIRSSLDCDVEQAEEIKKTWGLRPIGAASGGGNASMHPRQQIINDGIEQALRGLALEIGRSLAYHARGQAGGDIRVVGLTGGGARLTGLAEYVRDALRLEVTAPAVVREPPRESGEGFAGAEPGLPGIYGAAIGAALSGVE